MGLKTTLVDGRGTKNEAMIDIQGALLVTQSLITEPPKQGTANHFRFFSQLVSSVGDGTGTTNMNVDGSVTPQTFTISSTSEYDIHIMKIMIYIQDGTVAHDRFGAINPATVTNGVDISIFEEGSETKIVDSALTFAELIQQTFAEKPFGDGATAFELQDVSVGNDDAQILPFDVSSLIPNGIRLGRGTKNELLVRVQDDLTGLVAFTVRAVGYKHYP
jgi:hypothetical protein